MKRVWLIGLIACVLGWGQPQPAQVVFQQVFDNLDNAPRISAVLPNIGQSTHIVVARLVDLGACIAPYGNAEIHFQRSWDNIVWFDEFGQGDVDFFQIDDLGTIYAYGFYQGSFPYTRIRVEQFDTVNCRLDVFYSGTVGTNGGVLAQIGEGLAGQDNVTNSITDVFNSSGASNPVRNAPLAFDGNAWDRLIDCEDTVAVSVGAGATTQLVALAAGEQIRVCSFSLSMAAAGTVQLITGTGVNCAAGPTALTGAYTLAQGIPLGVGGNLGRAMTGPAGDALCLVTTGAGATAQGVLSYAQY